MRSFLFLAFLLTVVSANLFDEHWAKIKSGEKSSDLKDHLAGLGADLNFKFSGLGDSLKGVGSALLDYGKSKIKSLFNDTLGALVGAAASSLPAGTLIGKKRELDLVTAAKWFNIAKQAASSVHEKIDSATAWMKQKFHSVVDQVVSVVQHIQPEHIEHVFNIIDDLKEDSKRGVLSDTLNTGIDWIKNIWNKLTSEAKPEVPLPFDPDHLVMSR